jgi:hypothetical protein
MPIVRDLRGPLFKTPLLLAALAVAALAGPTLAGAAIPQGNLIQNPGAEDPAAPADDAGVAHPTDWLSPSPSFTVMGYGRNVFPATSVSDAIGGGANFFAGGPNTADSFAEQFPDITGAAAEIDAGHVRADLSAYLGGVGSQGDAATITVTFNSDPQDDGGTDLGTLTVGPVTAADRNDQTTLLRRDASATVPPGTRSAHVVIEAARATDGGAYDDGYADNVSLVLSDNTQPPPPPPPPPPPLQPAAPQVTAVHPAGPIVAGQTAVVSAQIDGPAQRLLWDLDGDGKPDVGCDGSQTTLTFRVPSGASARAGDFNQQITVQAVGAAGTGPVFAVPLTVAAAAPAGSAIDRRVEALVDRHPAVTACGKASDLPTITAVFDKGLANRLYDEVCHDMTVHAGLVGGLEVSGCFFRLHSLAEVPPAERGLFTSLSGALNVPTHKLIGDIPHVLSDSTSYESRGAVTVDGVRLTPRNGASIIVAPSFYKVFSSDAAFTVGGIRLHDQPNFTLDTTPSSGGRIPLGSFPRLTGGLAALGGFSLAGNVDVTLTPGTPETPAGAEISAHLQLPSFLEVGGVHVQGDVRLRVTGDGVIVLDNLRIGPIDAEIGPLGVQGLQIDYTRDTQEWKGQAALCVVVVCLDAREIPGEAPPGGVLIRNGQLVRAFANLDFPDPGITLFAGVQLNRIGAGVGLDPTRFLGGAQLTALGIFEINGALVLALPTDATPFILTREENGNDFPANFYGRPYKRFTLALGADASLKVPLLSDPIKLASAYFLYEAPGYVAFGGGVDRDFFDVLSLSGGADGEFNAANGRFNLSGHLRVCVADVVCAGAIAYLSSVGVGGCVTIDAFFGDINIGGGVVYNPFDIKLWPFDGCRWTRFKDDNVFEARAAQAGKPITVHVTAGERSQAVALDSVASAARIRVVEPGGTTVESPAGPGTTLTPAVRIVRSEQLHQTVVGLVDPKPGDYMIDVLPDSPAVTKVSRATDPPPAHVTAGVRGRGSRRTLAYDILERPQQSVTFVEVSGVTRRPIGTVSGGGRGTLHFTPAPGSDVRHIEAQFTLDGIRAETRTVASFRPPPTRLGRPAHLRVRRRANTLIVSWRRVPGATGYELVATSPSTGQRVVRARGAHATLRRIALTSTGRISLRATAPMRQGAPASARFRATRRLKTRFAVLPHTPRALRHG